jgi:CRP-like cAMP-binding protein
MPGTKVSLELQNQLRAIATPIRRKKGAILFRTGRPCRGAFLIRTGQIRLTLDGDSSLYPPRTLGPGSLIGLPATFSGEPYSLTAQVAKDCDLDFIPRQTMLNLLRRDPKVGLQIVRMLSQEVSRMRRTAKRTARSANTKTEL